MNYNSCGGHSLLVEEGGPPACGRRQSGRTSQRCVRSWGSASCRSVGRLGQRILQAAGVMRSVAGRQLRQTALWAWIMISEL